MSIPLEDMLPNDFKTYDANTQQSVISYLSQLDPIAQMAVSIGKQHLGTSFHILKSNGYQDWFREWQQTNK